MSEAQQASAVEAPQAATKNRRTLVGRIVSDKAAKTVTVQVERRVKHELYGKIVARSSKYHAHDENNEFKTGDLVEISESRPLSKTKSWVVTKLLEKARAV
jgi:small subunit ribosomal protein S17